MIIVMVMMTGRESSIGKSVLMSALTSLIFLWVRLSEYFEKCLTYDK